MPIISSKQTTMSSGHEEDSYLSTRGSKSGWTLFFLAHIEGVEGDFILCIALTSMDLKKIIWEKGAAFKLNKYYLIFTQAPIVQFNVEWPIMKKLIVPAAMSLARKRCVRADSGQSCLCSRWSVKSR